MSRILYIQNGEHDRPGLFAEALEERGVHVDVLHAWRGEPVPTVPNGWSGIAVGGGYMSAYETEEYPFLRDEAILIRAAREKKRPVLGMCLGAQLMAGAFGGKVFANRTKEIGFYEVRFTPEAERDRLWQGLTQPFHPVHWHGDTFTLPSCAALLASSDLTPNQLFRIDDTLYGVQFHLEIDGPILTEMVETDEGWLPQNGVDPEAFLSAAEYALPKVEPLALELFTRWTELLA